MHKAYEALLQMIHLKETITRQLEIGWSSELIKLLSPVCIFIHIFLTILAEQGNGLAWEAEGTKVCLSHTPIPLQLQICLEQNLRHEINAASGGIHLIVTEIFHFP